MGDEKWVLHNNVQYKCTWKQAGEHGDAMAKTSLHPMKVMLCVWWDCKGIIYFEFLPASQTIDSYKYCHQLTNLNREIKQKRLILSNRKGAVFRHDNARPHISRQMLRKLNGSSGRYQTFDITRNPQVYIDID